MAALSVSLIGGLFARTEIPATMQIARVVASVVVVAYGILLILTAYRQHHPLIWHASGFDANPVSTIWYGLAFVLPVVLVYGSTLLLPTHAGEGFWWFAWPVVFALCVIRARAASMRQIKKIIVSGLAPSYPTSPDGSWWWDGTTWLRVSAAIPADAVRSPDDGYWWTGVDWLKVPSSSKANHERTT
jgi:hypothetical protein